MDTRTPGEWLRTLRQEKGWTQKQLAEKLHITDKAVSKWERGRGLPDVALLPSLSDIFKVDLGKLLAGDLAPGIPDGGNMKRIKFYVCDECGNVMTSLGEGEVFCCGRKLSPLVPLEGGGEHSLRLEESDGEWYATLEHPMTKEHFISFVAWVLYDRVLLVKLYPEQEPALRLPHMGRGILYLYCTRHGLLKQKL